MKATLQFKATLELEIDLSEEKLKELNNNLPLDPNDLEEYGLEEAVWNSGILDCARSAELVGVNVWKPKSKNV